MRQFVHILFLWAFPFVGLACAQSTLVIKPPDDSPLTKVYTTDDGLPQNTPTAIVQTRDGYIWIATFGGLARFDGLKFTVFTTSEFPELANNRLTALAEDKYGILWIGSEDGDLVSYQNGKFSIRHKSSGEIGDSVIRAIYPDDDLLWIGSDSGLSTY